MDTRDTWFMLALYILTLAFYLVMAFQTPHFTTDESYFWRRQALSILETGRHFTYDPLSLGGRTLSFPPLFAYILAFAALFGELAITGKILLNAIAATIVIFVYLSSLHLTGSRHASSLASLVGAITPAWIAQTTTTLSPLSIAIPLLGLLIYSYFRIESRIWTIVYLAALTTLLFLHPISMTFVLSLIPMVILCRIENIQLRKEDAEIGLFSLFFMVWAMMVQYKKAILSSGIAVIWQNIPTPILKSYFTDVDILTSISYAGLVPFAAGIFVTYRYLLRKQSLLATFLISQALMTSALLYFRLLSPKAGYPLIGLFLSLLFSIGYQSFLSWLSQTQWKGTHLFVPLAIFLLVLSTSLIPSLILTFETIKESGMEDHTKALQWLKDHTPPDATVLTFINEGRLLTSLAERKSVIDADFLMIPDARERYDDYQTILTTPLPSTALSTLLKYQTQYVYVSKKFLARLSPQATWLEQTACFSPVYTNAITIYQVTCNLEHI